MAAQLKKNFEEYAAQGVEDHEEEVEDTKPEDKKFDLSIYDKLKSENGKTGPTIFFNLLWKVFDGEVQNSLMISVGMHFSCFSPGSVDWNDLSRRLIGAESLFVARSMCGLGRPVAMKPCATDPIAVVQVALVRKVFPREELENSF